MCAPPIFNGPSPNVFEILILTLVPPALVRTTRRTVWLRKVRSVPGNDGCGAVAHVPIHRRSFCSMLTLDAIAGRVGPGMASEETSRIQQPRLVSDQFTI
jgi:hypothetical protein